ncbi:MAG: hypothetical protein NT154_12325 [Verrucomicrobia bacterium]|nr:hypothetical protein [Verrucomicrobiota bacterium]
MNWLDTQTKELLPRVGDDKLVPPKTAEFALILLRKGPYRERPIEAIAQINTCSESDAASLARRRAPVTINPGLTEEEALWGQFKLIMKARIMHYWARRVGGKVGIDLPEIGAEGLSP